LILLSGGNRERNYSFGFSRIGAAVQNVRKFVIKNSLLGVMASLQRLAFNILKRLDQIMIPPLSGSIAFGKNPNILS